MTDTHSHKPQVDIQISHRDLNRAADDYTQAATGPTGEVLKRHPEVLRRATLLEVDPKALEAEVQKAIADHLAAAARNAARKIDVALDSTGALTFQVDIDFQRNGKENQRTEHFSSLQEAADFGRDMLKKYGVDSSPSEQEWIAQSFRVNVRSTTADGVLVTLDQTDVDTLVPAPQPMKAQFHFSGEVKDVGTWKGFRTDTAQRQDQQIAPAPIPSENRDQTARELRDLFSVAPKTSNEETLQETPTQAAPSRESGGFNIVEAILEEAQRYATANADRKTQDTEEPVVESTPLPNPEAERVQSVIDEAQARQEQLRDVLPKIRDARKQLMDTIQDQLVAAQVNPGTPVAPECDVLADAERKARELAGQARTGLKSLAGSLTEAVRHAEERIQAVDDKKVKSQEDTWDGRIPVIRRDGSTAEGLKLIPDAVVDLALVLGDTVEDLLGKDHQDPWALKITRPELVEGFVKVLPMLYVTEPELANFVTHELNTLVDGVVKSPTVVHTNGELIVAKFSTVEDLVGSVLDQLRSTPWALSLVLEDRARGAVVQTPTWHMSVVEAYAQLGASFRSTDRKVLGYVLKFWTGKQTPATEAPALMLERNF